MPRSSILLILFAMSTGPMALPSPARAGNEVSERRIILLGARWCAPCMAEWRNLPRLAAMVAPDRIVLAWVDRPIPVPPALAPQVSAAPVVEAQALAVKYGGQGFGLPMATIIDGRDKACPVWRRPLRPENVAEFYQTCLGH